MSKYIRTVICLVFLATIAGAVSGQDDAICEALRKIHAAHGNSLTAYLSVKGEDCLKPAETLAPTATQSGPIWSAEGQGPSELSISVKLSRGMYSLYSQLWSSGADNYAQLKEIVSVPNSCFTWEEVTFPSSVRVERECSIHATLEVDIGNNFSQNNDKSWAFSIRRESEELPSVSKANGWSESGIGAAHIPVEVMFEAGIYRFEKHQGPDSASLYVASSKPDGYKCFGTFGRYFSMPTQLEVKRRCHIKGTLKIGDLSVARGWHAKSWSYSITKLD